MMPGPIHADHACRSSRKNTRSRTKSRSPSHVQLASGSSRIRHRFAQAPNFASPQGFCQPNGLQIVQTLETLQIGKTTSTVWHNQCHALASAAHLHSASVARATSSHAAPPQQSSTRRPSLCASHPPPAYPEGPTTRPEACVDSLAAVPPPPPPSSPEIGRMKITGLKTLRCGAGFRDFCFVKITTVRDGGARTQACVCVPARQTGQARQLRPPAVR